MTHFYNSFDDSETPVAPRDDLVPDNSRPVTVRSGNGLVSYNGNEAAERNTYASVNMADVDPSGGLRARTPTGSPRQGTLQPTDVISVAGTETTVQNAASLGLIEQGPNGRWLLVPDGAARAVANEQPQEAYEDAGEALPNAAAEQDLADLASTITPTTQVALAQQIIADGSINQNTLARAAGEAGQEPGVIGERINTVVQSFQAQTDSMLKGLGADDTSQFYQWAQENHPQELRKAMTDQVMERTTRGYQPLFNQYVETLADHSAEDVLNASYGSGITARMEGKQVLLNIPGYGTMPYRSAIKAGLITVRGA
jgi:hypothetical protein